MIDRLSMATDATKESEEKASKAILAKAKLGLKWKKQKVTVEMMIIDHMQKTPTEN